MCNSGWDIASGSEMIKSICNQVRQACKPGQATVELLTIIKMTSRNALSKGSRSIRWSKQDRELTDPPFFAASAAGAADSDAKHRAPVLSEAAGRDRVLFAASRAATPLDRAVRSSRAAMMPNSASGVDVARVCEPDMERALVLP